MKQKLKNQVNLLDENLERLVQELKSYSSERLNTQPAPESWSPIQVLHHLMLAERYSLAYCQKKLSFKPTLKTAGWMENIQVKIVDFALASPISFNAPKPISGNALPAVDELEKVHSLWLLQRKLLHEFIDELPQEYLDKQVYKHPFGGRLSIFGMLQFFESHFKSHKKQIFRALS